MFMARGSRALCPLVLIMWAYRDTYLSYFMFGVCIWAYVYHLSDELQEILSSLKLRVDVLLSRKTGPEHLSVLKITRTETSVT